MNVVIYKGENTVNITQYLLSDGFQIQVNGVNGSNAGTNLNGDTIRDVIARKRTISVKLSPMNEEDISNIVDMLTNDDFYIQYTGLQGAENRKVFCESISFGHLYITDSETVYKGFSFTLTEI